jgi:hypothetical protein
MLVIIRADQLPGGVAKFFGAGKVPEIGKSRHGRDFTGCTAQFSPCRKMHSPFVLSIRARLWRSCARWVYCWMKFVSARPLTEASRVISLPVKRTCPGQRSRPCTTAWEENGQGGKILGNHRPIISFAGIGRRRVEQMKRGIGANEIGQGVPTRQVRGKLNVPDQTG